MRAPLLPLLLYLPLSGPIVASPQRVACVGDSITFGAHVAGRERNAYPAQLARLLGPEFEVRNFGASGCTLLQDADAPYVKHVTFREALAWKPDVSIVMLGTNDTCQNERRANWEHAEFLERDARRLATALLAEREQARVILCAPTNMFPEAEGLAESRRDDLLARRPRLETIARALRRVAAQDPRIDYLDLSGELSAALTVDGVHTTPFGARAIARRVAEAVQTESAQPLAVEQQLQERALRPMRGEFLGYPRLDFELTSGDGASFAALLVLPHTPAADRPWIWRARFFGHEPELDRELLSRGYTLAYCDVAGLFGADEALARFDRFHALCTGLGLSQRATLEGLSRGGLVVLNWAASRPQNVEAIYLDNPVCDFCSWPGGVHGKRSGDDWTACLAAYGLNAEQAANYNRMPLDRLAPLAEANVPLMLVLGGADRVVPPEENGELLVQRYAALGGEVEVWRKPNAGHHPHGLHPVQPLLRTLLRVTGRGRNPAAWAIGSAEYRGAAAGWGGGTWWDQLAQLRALGKQHPDASVVFLGDSITQGLTGSKERVATPQGTRAFDRYQGASGALCLGLSGDRTEHLLYRVDHGALANVDPQVIVLMIGVNNINAGHTGVETAAGLEALVKKLLQAEPQASLLLCGPFPTGADARDPKRRAIDVVHARAAALGRNERVTYVDLRPLFLDAQGRPNERMRGDHIHINSAGQEAWLAAIAPILADMK